MFSSRMPFEVITELDCTTKQGFELGIFYFYLNSELLTVSWMGG